MQTRDRLIALGVVLMLGLSACSGGAGSSPSTLPQAPSQPTPATTATQTYPLSSAAASYALPPLAGFSGSFAFPAADVPPQTTLTLTSSLQAPAGAPTLQDVQRTTKATGALNIYFFATATFSNRISLPAIPGFSVNLPANINPNQLFFYAFSIAPPRNGALRSFRTEGPAVVKGHTVTFAPSFNPVTIEAGQSIIVALYSISTPVANQGLWVANGTDVLEFIPSQFQLGTVSPPPNLINRSGVFGSTQGVVFDAEGDLWVIDGGTVITGGKAPPALYEFTPAQLAALKTTPNPSPHVTITSHFFTFPQQAVFDKNGNLWASDDGSNAVFEFTPAQLAVGGTNVTPNVDITSSPAFNGALGIVFAPNGNLWIANNNTTTLFEFNASTLPTSGTHTLTPNVILSDDGHGSIQGPWALVFDTAGNLWSSNANPPNTLVEFGKGSLAFTGSPFPIVTLSPTTINGNLDLASPNGIAFNNVGDLAAVSSITPFGIALFGQSQLTRSGAVVPDVFIVGPQTTLSAPAGNNFGPLVP